MVRRILSDTEVLSGASDQGVFSSLPTLCPSSSTGARQLCAVNIHERSGGWGPEVLHDCHRCRGQCEGGRVPTDRGGRQGTTQTEPLKAIVLLQPDDELLNVPSLALSC